MDDYSVTRLQHLKRFVVVATKVMFAVKLHFGCYEPSSLVMECVRYESLGWHLPWGTSDLYSSE